MLIAVDIDGVCADLLEEAIRTWGTPLVPYAYSLEEMFPMVPEREIEKWVSSPLTYQNLSPIEQAKESLVSLKKSGWHIVYATYRPFYIETNTWLNANGFPAADIVHATDKRDCVEECDVVVEDNLDTAVSLTEVCDNVFLVDWPYNQGPTEDAIRVRGWKDILEMLNGKFGSMRCRHAH